MNWTVHSCGTQVRISANNDISGTITGIMIRFQNLQYEVTWWDDSNRRYEWFNPEELDFEAEPHQQIKAVQ